MACRYAGIDWASQRHDVLVADEDGSELLAGAYAHDEKGLTALCRMLMRLEVALVAVERPDGLLVERLLDAGLRVLPLHPNKVAAARDRFRVAGGKSDRLDASCCASWRGLTTIGSGCSSRTLIARRRSGR